MNNTHPIAIHPRQQKTKSTCCYCGVGCGVIITTEDKKIIDVKGDPDHPANFGRLCTKGATLHLTAKLDARQLYPELRKSRGEPRRRVSWDASLDYVVDRFAETIEKHGPDSVAFIYQDNYSLKTIMFSISYQKRLSVPIT